ncbi:hypothetical protein Pmar_PMAR010660 [Perkinsus marinus ATCC 50983]|uniref:Uncharacterized protein n=1 Tax=Perkinsus marinus (strain ATCC 50983 / TXsc) TaxID=423536 RepID=C5L419_PERM5|nr:hypothetical protein Pmar_PMAR010660 [Perkinsus marinus ATCC 50983]EER08525.1 hypothetical protein Pmar_PMAR010660 [Perkinsus marinus ATCC 50983]|eukprot:XP_002776709.1 hypothetical protein Pmar_PMAR010660 [Perkinsus marinus ATCC 50983]
MTMNVDEISGESGPMMLDMGTQMSACREMRVSFEGVPAESSEKGQDITLTQLYPTRVYQRHSGLSQASTDISTSQVIDAVNESRDFIDQRLGETRDELKEGFETTARVCEIVAGAIAEESAKLEASIAKTVAASSEELRSEFKSAQEGLHLRLKALGVEIEALRTSTSQQYVIGELERLKSIELTCEQTKARLDQIEAAWAERRIQGSAEQQQDRSEYTNDATESCRDQSNNGRRTECTAAEECRCAQHV